MKKIIILVSYLILSFALKAENINKMQAEIIAKNYFYSCITKEKKISYEAVMPLLADVIQENNQNYMYIFNFQNLNGFIIISATSNTQPVLALSIEQSFDLKKIITPISDLIDLYKKQIEKAINENLICQNEKMQDWENYKNIYFEKAANDVSPLITVNWNQVKYYNEQCPVDASSTYDGHALVGCGGVAFAQLLKYWNYPLHGVGTKNYNTTKYGDITVNFSQATYNWSNMPTQLSTYNADVALLMYHAAAALNTSFGPQNSMTMALNSKTALDYFNYKYTEYKSKSSYTDSEWDLKIQNDLQNNRPLYYMGYGHTFNIDGVQNNNYYHINWGWQGLYNGYFYLNDLTPGQYDFTSSQISLFGVEPDITINIEKNNADKRINVYPNPFIDQIKIETELSKNSTNICLYNLSGELIISGQITNNTFKIGENIPKGTYLIKIFNEEIDYRELIVKE
ncbi:MAG: thiol protease/hemagglutinin PrtT [Bacteroidota bacterium]